MQTIRQTDRRKERPSSIGPIWPWYPTRKNTKKVSDQTQLDNGYRHDTRGWGGGGGFGRVLHILEVCEVKSYLMRMIEHMKMMQIPYTQAIQVTSLGCTKTCQFKDCPKRKTTYHSSLCIVFFHKLISMQDVGHMLHLNAAQRLPSL